MNSTPPPIIESQNLVKIFRDFWHRPKVLAVTDLSFAVRPGEVFGLLGPNGSGKSTTIKMLLGLLHPTKGKLKVLGRSPRDVITKSRVGYLPEESYLYPYLTPEETLQFFGRLFNLSARERRERIDQLLEMIGLQHARRRVVGEFSKGMARRVGLAQALINDPDLVVLDEPTSGLDPLGCRQVKDLIRAMARRGKTVLLSSHLLADVEDVCDRVAILYNGRLRAMGSISDLLERKNQYRLTLPEELSADQLQHVLARVRELVGSEPDLDHPRVDLEQFFIRIIEEAKREMQPPSGSTPSRAIATYLTPEPPSSTAVIDRLATPASAPEAKTEEPVEPTPPPSPPVDVGKHLSRLTRPTDHE